MPPETVFRRPFRTENILNKNERKLILLSVLLWLASLPCEVFPGYTGMEVLVLGTLFGWMVGIGYFAVYANPVYAVLLLQGWFGRGGKAVRVSLLAVMWGLALLTFTLDKIIVSEAPTYVSAAYGAGLYLWFAALAVATIASIRGWRQTDSRLPEQAVYRIRR